MLTSVMAADVSSIVRLMSDRNNEGVGDDAKTASSRDLVTRDFLGCAAGSKDLDLDLDLKVPSGWERRLDLLSGETYLEKSGSNPAPPLGLQDLNLPPPPADGSALDLKLLLRSAGHRTFEYQSVCTLDKVRSALERAGRESQSKRNSRSDGSPSPSSSAKRRSDDLQAEANRSNGSTGSMIAVGCPSCLLYVLISKANPRCPRCNSHVPVVAPIVAKKPRIDLNSTK